MKHSLAPQISSFVLRFVQEDAEESAANRGLRGSIRHIQSNQEVSFTRWADALAFMGQFVSPETFHLVSPDSAQMEENSPE